MFRPFITILLIACFFSQGYADGISFTKEDRDRLIRNEERLIRMEERLIRMEEKQALFEKKLIQLDKNQVQITANLKALEKQMDYFMTITREDFSKLYNLFFWGFGLFFGVIAILIGYLIYDRRTIMTQLK